MTGLITWGRRAGVTGSGTGFMATETLTAGTRSGGGGDCSLIPGGRGGLETQRHFGRFSAAGETRPASVQVQVCGCRGAGAGVLVQLTTCEGAGDGTCKAP